MVELSLDKEALRSVRKKTGGARGSEAVVEQVRKQYAFSQERCDARVAILSYRYQTRRSDVEALLLILSFASASRSQRPLAPLPECDDHCSQR